jgi:hypothetical protein
MDQQNPSVNIDPAEERRTQQLRAEIDRTRDDMSETVNAIQDRLRPSTVAANAAESMKHAAMSKARDVADSDSVSYMAANPVPMTMVAIGAVGLAWLATAGRNPRLPSYRRRDYFTPRREASWAGERDRSYGDEEPTAYTGASYATADRAGSSHYSPANRPAGGYRAASSAALPSQAYLQRAWHQNPLMIGVAAAVAGAVVGLGVPETDRENELMGETRDRMIDTVQDTVRDKVDQVQQAATTAVSSVQDAAKEAVGLGSSQSADTDENRADQSSRS